MTNSADAQTNTADNPDTTSRPKELVIDIQLPLLDSAAGVDLDVQERSLVLVRTEPPRHELRLALPYPVDETAGGAKFDKANRRLTVSLPIRAAATLSAAAVAVPKTERLSSNDSGIDLTENDDGYRTTVSGDGRAVAASSFSAAVDNDGDSDDADDKPSEKADASGQGVDMEGDSFLESSVAYTLPAFNCVVQPPVISFTLEVKNVDPSTVVRRVWPDQGAVGVRFASLGSGLFPLSYAFFIKFQAPKGCLEESDLDIGRCWK